MHCCINSSYFICHVLQQFFLTFFLFLSHFFRKKSNNREKNNHKQRIIKTTWKFLMMNSHVNYLYYVKGPKEWRGWRWGFYAKKAKKIGSRLEEKGEIARLDSQSHFNRWKFVNEGFGNKLNRFHHIEQFILSTAWRAESINIIPCSIHVLRGYSELLAWRQTQYTARWELLTSTTFRCIKHYPILGVIRITMHESMKSLAFQLIAMEGFWK